MDKEAQIRERRNEASRVWQASPEGKAWLASWRARPENRAKRAVRNKAAYAKMMSTPEGRTKRAERRRKYYYSPKGQKNHPEKGREYYLKHEYGLTVEEYDRLLAMQNGVCAICLGDTNKGRGRGHVDHDHKTGRIRGILCSACNHALGLLREDLGILDRARAYLVNNGRKEKVDG